MRHKCDAGPVYAIPHRWMGPRYFCLDCGRTVTTMSVVSIDGGGEQLYHLASFFGGDPCLGPVVEHPEHPGYFETYPELAR